MRHTKDFGIDPGFAVPCSLCGNDTRFTAVSDQVTEGIYELRVICRCGFDRAESNGHCGYQSDLGELTQDAITAAFFATWGQRGLICRRGH